MQLELSISLAGLEREEGAPWALGPRVAIEWAAGLGFRGVQLDGTAAGIRARELDRSARRDLAALLRRAQLKFSGLDLWIPSEHFADAARSERALEAVLGAIDLAAELARLVESGGAVISLALPAQCPEAVRGAIAMQAETRGVAVADHTLRESTAYEPFSPLGVGMDPAAALLAGRDPAMLVIGAGKSLKSARLSDASAVGRVRVGGPGARLDVLEYEAALAAAGYQRPVIADLRGVREQGAAAQRLASAGPGLGGQA